MGSMKLRYCSDTSQHSCLHKPKGVKFEAKLWEVSGNVDQQQSQVIREESRYLIATTSTCVFDTVCRYKIY